MRAMFELTDGWKEVVLALSVPGLYCLMVLIGRRLKHRHGVRLGWAYHAFGLGLAIYVPARLMAFQWPFLHHLGAADVILGALFLIALVDRYVWHLYFQERHQVSVPKFLTEVARLAILVVALFLVLEFDYGQTIRGLLLAPGIAAVVVGLAMQDLMSNIIAGMALQLARSFAHGDWLFVDNRYAEVIEINWRATRLRTNDDICVEVPNRELARQSIINLNRPHRLHAVRIGITLDAAVPPNRVKEVLLHATSGAHGVAPDPKPKVFLKNFAESGIDYEIKFYMDNFRLYNEVCDAIRTNLWYGLRRHGIRIPYPTRTLQLERPARDKQREVQSAARAILRQQSLFRCLADDQLDALLPRGRIVHFGRGEKLIQQGDNGDSMFILVEGHANVLVKRDGGARRVASLKSGDCFGEMSLLTGELRSATVLAESDCEVVEISKSVLAITLKEQPELLGQLSNLLAQRQLENEGLLASVQAEDTASVARGKTYAAGFLKKLHSFFEL